MKLGDAPQGQGVLYPVALILLDDAGTGQDAADVFGGVPLVSVGAHLHHPRVKGVHHALQGLQRHGPDDVGGLGGLLEVVKAQSRHGGGGGGAGHQGQTLLRAEGNGLQTGLFQGLVAGQQLALVIGLAPADEHQGHVGLGGQIAHAAVPGGPGGHAPVQELAVLLQQLQPHAAVALAQVLQDHQHDAPHPLDAQGLAQGDGVGQDDVLLQLGRLLFADGLGTQGAKAGGDTVHHLLLVHPALHQLAGLVHPLAIVGGELHLCTLPAHSDKLLHGDGLTQHDGFLFRVHNVPPHCAPPPGSTFSQAAAQQLLNFNAPKLTARSGPRCPRYPSWSRGPGRIP